MKKTLIFGERLSLRTFGEEGLAIAFAFLQQREAVLESFVTFEERDKLKLALVNSRLLGGRAFAEGLDPGACVGVG